MTEINIKVDDKEVMAMLARVHARISDMAPVMREVSGIMLDAVEENFEQEGRPKWAPLSPSTIRQRQRKGHWPGRILQVSGGLVSSLSRSYDSQRAIVGVDKKGYAAVHQFGSRPGSGRNIPARPFLRLTDSDMEEIKGTLGRYIEKGA